MGKTFMDKMFNNYKRQKFDKLNSVLNGAITRLNNDMSTEANNMYDSMINDFYSFETTSYIRHWEYVAGTRHGESLKMAKYINANNNHGKNQTLTIDFSADKMISAGVKYQHHNPSEVVDFVLSGIRFQLEDGGRRIEWATTYHGKYFSHSGNIYSAFEYFGRNFNSISSEVFYSFWDEYIPLLSLK